MVFMKIQTLEKFFKYMIEFMISNLVIKDKND
jgi:hypothetical protein